MSYRNPQIIQDRSGEIIPQALAQATGAIAQGVAKFGTEQKREREKRELERKQFNQNMIKLSNEQAADASLFNKGLAGMSDSMRQQMVLGNNAALERIYAIKKAQMQGNADPALSERLAQEQMKIATYNELAKAAIGATGDLPEMVRNYDQAGKTMFLTQDKDGSTAESDALFNGFGGAPGYEAGLKYKGDGSMVAWAKNKEGKYFEINAQNFPERMQNLTIQAKNPVNEMVESQSSMLYDKKGNFLPNIVEGETVLTRGDVNELGQSTTYERQALNTTQINKVREELFESNLAKINSAEGNRQLQDYYLDMFNIDVDAASWRNLSPEDKQKKVYASSDEIFFNSTKIEEAKEGDATTGYFRKLNEKSYNPPKQSTTKLTEKQKNRLAYDRRTDNYFAQEGVDKIVALEKSLDLNNKARLNNQSITGISFNPTGFTVNLGEDPNAEIGAGGVAPSITESFTYNSMDGQEALVTLVNTQYFGGSSRNEAEKMVANILNKYKN